MKCRSRRINETTCKHLWFFDRPQTVQCVSGESLSSKDFETLGEYCTKDNRTCDLPCEYAKRKRMVGSVHDDCYCQTDDVYEASVDCSREEDLFKARCQENNHGNKTLMFCVSNTTVSKVFFGFKCYGMSKCEISCSVASISPGELKIQKKHCYCYNSHAGNENVEMNKTIVGSSILFVFFLLFQ